MNLTLSVDERIVERARGVARSMNKSLDQVIREYLEQLAGRDDAERDSDELDRLSMEAHGHSRGWHFNRDEIHERS